MVIAIGMKQNFRYMKCGKIVITGWVKGGAKNCSMASRLDTGSPTDPRDLLRGQEREKCPAH